ncbi:MAG TPA: NADH:flavin oxidoreductase/NADH oxidase [Polyangia bacterium]|nr:NADH:flavin oxidoreductase/NADH oxidase [Polyangia bacterium]
MARPWHLVQLGRFAVGGAALVFTEAAAVAADARITPRDLGIWSDAHAAALAPIAEFIRANGAIAGIQLAHAGRKASTSVPWEGGKKIAPADGGWTPWAPSALAFSPTYPEPAALDEAGIARIIGEFAAATRRAEAAGFQVIELHFAHGYLMHEFLSPLANKRTDAWGGDFDGRTRLPLAVVEAVRAAWPAERPLFVRISASDWVDGGWDIVQSVRFAALLKARGVDLVDCSSGGIVPDAKIAVGPGYQVPFARAVKQDAHVASGAVGMITEAAQANDIVSSDSADAVLLARALLDDPNWALHAAKTLGADVAWPVQHERGKPR